MRRDALGDGHEAHYCFDWMTKTNATMHSNGECITSSSSQTLHEAAPNASNKSKATNHGFPRWQQRVRYHLGSHWFILHRIVFCRFWVCPPLCSHPIPSMIDCARIRIWYITAPSHTECLWLKALWATALAIDRINQTNRNRNRMITTITMISMDRGNMDTAKGNRIRVMFMVALSLTLRCAAPSIPSTLS